MGGGGGGGSTNTVQKADPWSGVQPYLKDLYGFAQGAYDSTPKAPYGGGYYAGPTGAQQQGNQMAMNLGGQLAGQGFGGQTAAVADNMAGKILNGTYTAPAMTSPQQTANELMANLQPTIDTITKSILPGLDSQAINAGAYGGSRMTNVQGQVTQGLTDEAARLALTDMQAKRELLPKLFALEQTGASALPGLYSGAVQTQLLPSQLLSGAGSEQQGWAQSMLDANRRSYDDSVNAPWQGLGNLSAILQNAPGGTTTTKSDGGDSTGGGIMSGLMGGGALGALGGSALGGLSLGSLGTAAGLGAFAPWLLGGAALGGLMGFM